MIDLNELTAKNIQPEIDRLEEEKKALNTQLILVGQNIFKLKAVLSVIITPIENRIKPTTKLLIEFFSEFPEKWFTATDARNHLQNLKDMGMLKSSSERSMSFVAHVALKGLVEGNKIEKMGKNSEARYRFVQSKEQAQ